MTDPIGINLWATPTKSRGKRSKTELIREIANSKGVKQLDIALLSIKELEVVLSVTGSTIPRLECDSKMKRSYVSALKQVIPDTVSIEKLSVASLKQLLEVFYDE